MRMLITVCATGVLLVALAVLVAGEQVWALDLLTFFWPVLAIAAVVLLLLTLPFGGAFARVAALALVVACAVPFVMLPPAPDSTAGVPLLAWLSPFCGRAPPGAPAGGVRGPPVPAAGPPARPSLRGVGVAGGGTPTHWRGPGGGPPPPPPASLRAGAVGFLHKNGDWEELTTAIRAAHRQGWSPTA